jgi:hypothetical protein
VLNGVDGHANTNVWAVGQVGSGTLIERWNGSSWTVVPSPNPPGTSSAVFRAVKTLAGNNAWAVGHAQLSSGTFPHQTLITRWDGTRWGVVPSPSPDPIQNLLLAVDGVAANDVWAIGGIGHDGYEGLPVAGLVLRWNGTSWTRAAIPDADATFSTIELRDVVAVASNDVWVVGRAFHRQLFRTVPYVLHWNGQSWQHGTIPNPPDGRFDSVTALSPTKVYAFGNQPSGQTLVARWNGSTWSRETTPSRSGYNGLTDASATGTGTVWAVGLTYLDGVVGTLAIRTNDG